MQLHCKSIHTLPPDPDLDLDDPPLAPCPVNPAHPYPAHSHVVNRRHVKTPFFFYGLAFLRSAKPDLTGRIGWSPAWPVESGAGLESWCEHVP